MNYLELRTTHHALLVIKLKLSNVEFDQLFNVRLSGGQHYTLTKNIKTLDTVSSW